MAFRHFLLSLIPLTLFSAPQDFKSCQLKYQVSSVELEKTQAFAIDNQYALFYSKEKPSLTLVKRDPFLGLNLVKSSENFKHVFKFYNNDPKHLAAVTPHQVAEGRLISEQVGLNRLAQFSSPVPKNALISGNCCGILGLSTGKGIIDKEYIRRFLASKKIAYSDIGIRVADKEGVRVVEVNPFFEDSPFLLDDLILSMDGKRAKNAAALSRDILFSKPGSRHHFVILREGERIKTEALFKERLSGGLVLESFFNLFGIELDEELVVKKDAPKYEIKKGDRLLFVMGKEVRSLTEIRRVLSQEKESKNKLVILLFKRKGFDFFIHFAKPGAEAEVSRNKKLLK